MDIVQTREGEWIGFFLSIRIPNKPLLHNLGRESLKVKIDWEEGWPIIKGGMEVDLAQPSPSSLYVDLSLPLYSYPFEKLRVPNNNNYIEDREKRSVTLIPNDDLKEERGEPTMLLLRQLDFSSTFKAYSSIEELRGKGGIIAWFTNDYYYRIIVEKNDGDTIVSSSLMVHGFESIKECKNLGKTEGSLELSIVTSKTHYSLC